MIDKFLKIAKVNNLREFYLKHPTEEHFFKAHPEAKSLIKKASKIRRPKKQDGGSTDEIMQMIQAYAQAKGVDPKEITNHLQQLQPEEQQQAIQQMMSELQGDNQGDYKYGGIHINPKNKGKFNALKKRTGKTTEQLTHSKNPLTRKRAIFAQNARKWKHQDGGQAQPQDQMQEGQPVNQGDEVQGQNSIQTPQQGSGMPQEHQQMLQQLTQMVVQALQKGMQPQQIIQMLVQQGIPQEAATQVVQMVMQQMQGGPGQQYQPQGNQYQGPQAQNGGMFFNQSYSPLDY